MSGRANVKIVRMNLIQLISVSIEFRILIDAKSQNATIFYTLILWNPYTNFS